MEEVRIYSQEALRLHEASNYGDNIAPITAQQASNTLTFAMKCFGNIPNMDYIIKAVSEINKVREDTGLLESINPFGMEDMSEFLENYLL